MVRVNDKKGVIKSDGTYLFEPIYDFAFHDVNEGVIKLAKDSKDGFFIIETSHFIEPQYDSAESFENGYASVELNGKKGYIDKQGKWFDKKPKK